MWRACTFVHVCVCICVFIYRYRADVYKDAIIVERRITKDGGRYICFFFFFFLLLDLCLVLFVCVMCVCIFHLNFFLLHGRKCA